MTLPIGRTNEEDLVSSEQVARVDLVGHVVKAGVVAVGDDGLALALEGFEVAHNATAEEGGAVGKGGLVDDDFGSLSLDAFHDALNGRLAEVVAV